MLSFFVWLSLITLLVWLGFPFRIPSGRALGALALVLSGGLAYSLLKPAQAAPAPSANPPPTCTDTDCTDEPSEEPAPDPIGAGSDEVNVEDPALNSSDAGVVDPITCTNPKGCGDPIAKNVK